jgi:hypothetical protein
MHWDFDLRALWDVAGGNFAARFLSALVLTNFVYLRSNTRLSILRCVLADLAMAAIAIGAVLPSILVGALLRMAVSGTTVSSPALVLIFGHLRRDLHLGPVGAAGSLAAQGNCKRILDTCSCKCVLFSAGIRLEHRAPRACGGLGILSTPMTLAEAAIVLKFNRKTCA